MKMERFLILVLSTLKKVTGYLLKNKIYACKINKSQNIDRYSGVGIRLNSGMRLKFKFQTFV